ncbi:hypothetical protein H5410_002832 [Solanum commersonii]|uniref:Uncharacterized protein n=1 Tax=Solanum commersonii TaxID=4109 RepID=A0A9J6B3C2_SOLCO|nr:hypothetical protein H5410_002832 [Solanum commersonii]
MDTTWQKGTKGQKSEEIKTKMAQGPLASHRLHGDAFCSSVFERERKDQVVHEMERSAILVSLQKACEHFRYFVDRLLFLQLPAPLNLWHLWNIDGLATAAEIDDPRKVSHPGQP